MMAEQLDIHRHKKNLDLNLTKIKKDHHPKYKCKARNLTGENIETFLMLG